MRFLAHGQTVAAGRLDDQPAGHALQHPQRERRGDHRACVHEEDIGGRGLRHLPLQIEQERIVGAGGVRLAQGERAVQVVARLERRVERLGWVAPDSRDRELQTALVLLRRGRLERTHDHDQSVQSLGEVGSQAEAALAAGHDDPRVRFRIARRLQGALQLGLDARAGRQREPDSFRRPLHPSQVPPELEHPPAVGAHHFVDRVPIEESAVEHRHHRLLRRDQPPFDVDQRPHRGGATGHRPGAQASGRRVEIGRRRQERRVTIPWSR